MKGSYILLLRRIAVYMLGLLFMAFGVAFSVNSGLGVSPVNSLPYVISLILNVDMGRCVIGVFASYIVVQLLLLRRNFRWIQLTQLVFSTVFGYFVDFAKWALGDWALASYPGRLAMLFFSILLVALGVCLYMGTGLVNMPMEGMTKAVKDTLFPKTHFAEVKVAMDCGVVLLGVALSFLFLGQLEGIREGTVICAVLVGKVMKPLQKCLEPFLGRVCFEKRRETCERTKNVPGSDAGNDQSSGDSFRRNADAVDG